MYLTETSFNKTILNTENWTYITISVTLNSKHYINASTGLFSLKLYLNVIRCWDSTAAAFLSCLCFCCTKYKVPKLLCKFQYPADMNWVNRVRPNDWWLNTFFIGLEEIFHLNEAVFYEWFMWSLSCYLITPTDTHQWSLTVLAVFPRIIKFQHHKSDNNSLAWYFGLNYPSLCKIFHWKCQSVQ